MVSCQIYSSHEHKNINNNAASVKSHHIYLRSDSACVSFFILYPAFFIFCFSFITTNRETSLIGRMIVSTLLKFATILLTSCCCWSVVLSDEDDSQNCCDRDNCASYRGKQNTTVYGAWCLPWEDLPTTDEWHPDKHPNSGLVSNHPRKGSPLQSLKSGP